jgi:hypothetical protein
MVMAEAAWQMSVNKLGTWGVEIHVVRYALPRKLGQFVPYRKALPT